MDVSGNVIHRDLMEVGWNSDSGGVKRGGKEETFEAVMEWV